MLFAAAAVSLGGRAAVSTALHVAACHARHGAWAGQQHTRALWEAGHLALQAIIQALCSTQAGSDAHELHPSPLAPVLVQSRRPRCRVRQ